MNRAADEWRTNGARSGDSVGGRRAVSLSFFAAASSAAAQRAAQCSGVRWREWNSDGKAELRVPRCAVVCPSLTRSLARSLAHSSAAAAVFVRCLSLSVSGAAPRIMPPAATSAASHSHHHHAASSSSSSPYATATTSHGFDRPSFPLLAIFFAEFDNTVGPKITCQAPEGSDTRACRANGHQGSIVVDTHS